MLLGISANIRTSSTTCDLGTTANPFQNLYLNTGIESTGGLVIGPVTATSIAIGSAAITNAVNGTFVTAFLTVHGILPHHTIPAFPPVLIVSLHQLLQLLEHLLTLRMRSEC